MYARARCDFTVHIIVSRSIIWMDRTPTRREMIRERACTIISVQQVRRAVPWRGVGSLTYYRDELDIKEEAPDHAVIVCALHFDLLTSRPAGAVLIYVWCVIAAC